MPSESPDCAADYKSGQKPAESRETGTDNGGCDARSGAEKSTDSEEYHLAEAPDFQFEQGQSFKLANEPDPDEYWYVISRVWNYDADTDDALVQLRAYKQYVVGEVSTLGGNERLVTEDTLIQHYEPVEKEEAKEILQ